jgi:catechol 2,3-dioxygenase-like lactoylglutathione lyase family enzyme
MPGGVCRYRCVERFGVLASIRHTLGYPGAITHPNSVEATMERAIPVIPGDDIRAMKEFYVNKLGFTLTWENPSEDNEQDGMVGVQRGGIAITIDCPMSGHGRHACVSLEVQDADVYYDEWKKKVEIKRPPRNEYWGARTFSVQDPADNTIFIMGPLKAAAPSA